MWMYKRDGKYVILTIGRQKREKAERERGRENERWRRYRSVLSSSFPLNFFFLLRLCQSSILARSRITSALINPLEKSFLKRNRCSAAPERSVVPSDTAISPHIYELLWPWEHRDTSLTTIFRRAKNTSTISFEPRVSWGALSRPLVPTAQNHEAHREPPPRHGRLALCANNFCTPESIW